MNIEVYKDIFFEMTFNLTTKKNSFFYFSNFATQYIIYNIKSNIQFWSQEEFIPPCNP